MSSRLFQILREDHALAYSVYTTPSFFADTGDLVVSVGLDTSNLRKALRLITREFKRLRDNMPESEELDRAKEYLIGQMDLSHESTDSQMNWAAENLLGFGRIIRPADIKRRLLKITPAEIRSAAKAFLRPEHFNLALVSPLRSIRGLLPLLVR